MRPLGGSGVRVSQFCLGTGTFGNAEWGCEPEESQRIYQTYREAGGNFVDTANKYADGLSEEIVGVVTKNDRSDVVIGTKFTAAHPGSYNDGPNRFGNHAKSLRHSLDRSLERLQTDYVDVLWVHAWDPLTSIEDMMRALDVQVRAGRVLVLGASNMPAWVVAHANAVAAAHGWAEFSAVQVEYSLIERGAERDVFPMCSHMGLSSVAWAPLGWGILTGKYLEGAQEARLDPDHSKRDDRADAITRKVLEVAKRSGVAPSQVALAWVKSQPFDPIVLLGARSQSQLETSLAASSLELSLDDLGQLDAASAIDAGVPNQFLSSADGLEFFYGADRPEVRRVGDV
jgi:aryl-alcohol dehydrogenase-like predicted oxidoreductase